MQALWSNIVQYSLIFSVSGLLFYFLYFFKKLIDFKPQINTETPPVSVIICAKNELVNLKSFLPFTLNQAYKDFEVIVVVDHSKDGSYEYLTKVAKSNPRLRVFQFEEKKVSDGKKDALQFGINQASHEHLLLTDADCHPTSIHWIKHMASGFSDENQLVLGIGTYKSSGNKLLSTIIQWDSLMVAIQYLSYALQGNTYMSVGRNVAYTKSLFYAVSGFNSHMDISSGDDDLFVQEVKGNTKASIIINPSAHTQSVSCESWQSYLKQKSRHFTTSSKYPPSTLLLLGFYQLCTVIYYVSIIGSLFVHSSIALLLTMFLIKNFVQASVFRRIFFKIGVRVQLIPFLFFDIFWVALLTFVNIKRIISPSSKW
ncbi:MAG: biofilm PGA synthesis N-glycosyltransferase PgaC [Saprospiraceae bacterium]|jgi:biofilm PGA synthesis N-glycosyltransferase PgaC